MNCTADFAPQAKACPQVRERFKSGDGGRWTTETINRQLPAVASTAGFSGELPKTMRKGQLNKTELAKMARCYRDIDSLVDMLPKDTKDRHEQSTWDCLIKARNGLGELLRWQDFGGAWKAAQKENDQTLPTEGAAKNS